jgi:glutamate formiminotransferase/formiminotetrahydrofolate cyclodeaminase
MEALGVEAQALKDRFLELVDRDTEAFDAVLAAARLPKKSPEEVRARDAAMETANHRAAEVPLQVVEGAGRALELALAAARDGNPSSVSDAGVAGVAALAAAEGAALNVRINLPSLTDRAAAAALRERCLLALERARERAAEVARAVDAALQ